MGRHPKLALTAPAVKAFKSTGRTRRIADGNGLYLVATAAGSRSWVLRTIIRGKRSDVGLGSASLVSLAKAREEAHRLRSIARSGGDPLADRPNERREVPTFEAAAKQVHKAHSSTFRNEKHRRQWLASLAGVIEAFGAKRVDAVTSADILAALSPLWLKTPETSRRVLQRIRTIFDWCKAQGCRSGDNPTGGVTRALPRHRARAVHHAALPYQQVPTFTQALRQGDAGGSVRLAFEFTILCATRTSETLNATWDAIDLQGQTWLIPAQRMKAGVPHRVPLSARAVEILERAKALSGTGTYVFPGRTAKKPLFQYGVPDDLGSDETG